MSPYKAVSLVISSTALLLEEAAETAAAPVVTASVGIGVMLLFLLVLLVFILQDTTDNGAANGPENAMIGLVAGKTACDPTDDGTAQAAFTFLRSTWGTLVVAATFVSSQSFRTTGNLFEFVSYLGVLGSRCWSYGC